MSDNKEKIRKIFGALSPDRKEKVRSKLAEDYKLTVDSVKNNWIYGGKIPEEHVEEVLQIVKEKAKEQSDSILELIS